MTEFFKFAANLSTMFREYDMLERYAMAKKYGFYGVESQFLYDYPMCGLKMARESTGMVQVLINSYLGKPGEVAGTIFGPWRDYEYTIQRSINYAEVLQCKKIHICAAYWIKDMSFEDMEEAYLSNLKKTVKLLAQRGIVGVIEPMSKAANEKYFLNSFDKAVEYIEKINSPYLKLLLDVFHLQMICGNLTENIARLLPYTGHVQISQAPKRHEPYSSGEIQYRYILSYLHQLTYDGWIGLEYYPEASTIKGLSWLTEFKNSLGIPGIPGS